jgi:hypothetical protein
MFISRVMGEVDDTIGDEFPQEEKKAAALFDG